MNVFDQLRRDEGFRGTIYPDPATNRPTIGYGHNLAAPISPAAADQILRDDVLAVYRQLETQPWFNRLSDARAAVILNMGFNLGLTGLLGFKRMIAAITISDWNTAAKEMLDSYWATQVGARAVRLANQMRTDQWV